jgi:juvenile hormone epoxide hydrolase
MIYYLTNSITTSVRLYAVAFSEEGFKPDMFRVPVNVPVACPKFRYEVFNSLDWSLKDKYTNLIQSNHYHDGGHFIAMQLPDVLYKDLISFVQLVDKVGK